MSLPVEKLEAFRHVASVASEAGLPDGPPPTVIEASSGWQPLDLRDLWRYRELIYFLAWRDVKVRYKQTVLGAAWAILQPTLMMAVFTLVLGRIARSPADDMPYPLFVYAGLLPWMFFSTAITSAAQSVVSAERLVTKVYFPRLAIPLAALGPALVDFALASVVLGALMAWYGRAPSWSWSLVPGLLALLTLAALGVGTLLAALNVGYRDVRHAIPFLVQLWLFATPSVYLEPSADDALASGAFWLGLNPLDGLIAFFRAALLGGELPWMRVVYPALAAPGLVLAGCFYFRRVEDSFADIL